MRLHVVAAMILLSLVLTLTAARTEAQDVLKPMIGKWKASLAYTGGGGRVSRATVSLAEDTEVKQLDQNTIGFSLKPVTAASPVFDVRLTHDVASKKYLLTVKTDDSLTIERLVLAYGESSGFSGEGMLKDADGQMHKVQVEITAQSTGKDKWSFLDPSAQPGNKIVFRFDFLERI